MGKDPAYLTSMQSASCKIPGWIKHKLESRLLGEISVTSDMQILNARLDKAKAGIKNSRRNINNLRYGDDTTLMAESEEN